MEVITGTYNPFLVMLSYIVAAVASYTSLDILKRLSLVSGSIYFVLLTGSALTLGVGTWAMHYIGMIAFELPKVIRFNLWFVILSLVMVFLCCFIALKLIKRTPRIISRLFVGNGFITLGISGLFYISISGMWIEGVVVQFQPVLVLLSIVFVFSTSFLAFWLLVRFKESTSIFIKTISALILGFAISGMHYIGMNATEFYIDATNLDHGLYPTVNPTLMSVGIVVAVLIILSCAIIGDMFNRKLEEAERSHNSLFEHHFDMVLLIDNLGELKETNYAFKNVTGYDFIDYIGIKLIDLVDSSEIDKVKDLVARGTAGETIEFQLKLQHKDGQILEIEGKSIPKYAGNNVVGIYIVAKDITETVRSKKELEQLNYMHSLIINAVAEGILGVDLSGNVMFWNPAAEKITGYSGEEILNKNIQGLLFNSKENNESIANNPIEKAISKGEVQHVVDEVFWKKDGTAIPVEFISTPLKKDQKVIGAVVTFSDITERKQTDELIRHSEKLTVAGQLAAGIAHEIRNPLTAIKGFLQLTQSKMKEQDFYYDVMNSEIKRIELIISELLILAKPQVTKYIEIDIQILLKHVIALLETQANMNNIQIHTEIDTKQTMLYCDENQLKQVFINFIKNSIEAMPNGGIIIVRVYRNSYKQLVIQVIDQGVGIPNEVLERLGEPFFTTKDKGTGLGFLVSKKIIEDHGGFLSIKSSPFEGTTIEVTLPYKAREMAI